MRRLFFTFAHGPPGIGLLLLRLLAGSAIAAHSIMVLRSEPSLALALFIIFLLGLGLLLIAGFWTPVVAGSIAVIALREAVTHAPDRWDSVIVAVLGIALALLGPGAWSVDARLFGWKRLEVSDRKTSDPL